MINKITDQKSIISQLQKPQEQPEKSAESFKNTLEGFLQDVNELQINSKETTESFLNGEITDLHQVTIAAEEARLGLELLLEIRNKMMESYQEIMRMQI